MADIAREPDPQTVKLSEHRVMEEILGLDEGDPSIDELHSSGFRPSNVALLEVLPLVELAWADGAVTPRERQIVIEAAARRRDVRGSAQTQLAAWLAEPPPERIFQACRNTLRRLMSDVARSADRVRTTLELETTLLVSSAGGLLGTDAPIPEQQQRILRHLFAGVDSTSLHDAS